MHMCADLLKICGHVKEKGSKETSLRISHRCKLVPALCSFSTFLVLLHLCVRTCVCVCVVLGFHMAAGAHYRLFI